MNPARPGPPSRAPASRRVVTASLAGPLVGGLAFLLVLLDFGTDLGRTAWRCGYASNFFDGAGATRSSTGGVDVPGGRHWASRASRRRLEDLHVLRRRSRPCSGSRCCWSTQDFDGEMTVVSMLLACVVFAVMTTPAAVAGPRAVLGPEASRSPATVRQAVLGRGVPGRHHRRHDADLRRLAAVGLPRGLRCGRPRWSSAAAYWLVRVTAPSSPAATAWPGSGSSPARRC